MASPAQIDANRRNALRSTGPRTAAGRAAVRRNALRHGMTAEQVVLVDELPEDFSHFFSDLRDALAPADAIEEQLVERLVICAWRLRRACRCEAAVFDYAALGNGWGTAIDDAGKAFKRVAANIATLSRYETAIERSFHRAALALERMQARRRGEPVPAPIVVAVDGGSDPAAQAIR
jgi:hypothetical protein